MAANDVILMVFLFRYSTNTHSSWSLSKLIFPARTQLCSTKMREQSAADSAFTDTQGSKIKPFKIEHISRCVSTCLWSDYLRAVLTSLSACKTACMIESQEECFHKTEQHASHLSQRPRQLKHVTHRFRKVCPLNPEAQTHSYNQRRLAPWYASHLHTKCIVFFKNTHFWKIHFVQLGKQLLILFLR